VSRPKHVVYKAKKPLSAVTTVPPIKHMIVPAGSVLVWEHGDVAGESAGVSWLRQRIHIKQADLFMHCERVTRDDADSFV
jgi:hypothetical protein